MQRPATADLEELSRRIPISMASANPHLSQVMEFTFTFILHCHYIIFSYSGRCHVFQSYTYFYREQLKDLVI